MDDVSHEQKFAPSWRMFWGGLGLIFAWWLMYAASQPVRGLGAYGGIGGFLLALPIVIIIGLICTILLIKGWVAYSDRAPHNLASKLVTFAPLVGFMILWVGGKISALF